MEQVKLFHEDLWEALKTDVQALGGAKKVGHMFWPEKPVDKAGEHLNNCLNVTRNEKLDGEQILLIIREAKKVGSFATMHFQCQEAGFSEPLPIEPEDERARLQREYIEATKAMGRIAERMERLNVSGSET